MPNHREFPDTLGVVVMVMTMACGDTIASANVDYPGFVGSARCADCHATAYAAWQRSQHSVAMQVARPTTVLGRFDSARFVENGVTSTFFRRDGRYFVNTQAADGRPHDYEVRYTFGVAPLQQYLVELQGGRVQALAIAWDARPAAAGGQRWFTLNPGRRIAHTEDEHWSGRLYNWNFRCADCHSTAVRKNYEPEGDVFRTSWSEISVGCEACHGPGAGHVKWAKYPAVARRALWRDNGLSARLTERRGVSWVSWPGAPTARRSAARNTDFEIDVCAQCHARRIHIADGYTAGKPLLDYYIPFLLEAGSYYSDGQQREEVYNYGSFLQSRMYRAGVTCADCHDPHTQELRRPAAQVCSQCHNPATYEATTHHRHGPQTGATCISCHMPSRTYMVVDPRHDHSFRIPRPDLSVSLGTPNACNQCHIDRDARWAEQHVQDWYGRTPASQRFARAFAADDANDPFATDSLARVAHDTTESAIVRASALARLAGRPGPTAFEAAKRWSSDPNALIRLAALAILDGVPEEERTRLALPLLRDETRAIRQGAAWILAPVAASLDPGNRPAFDAAADEFVASQRYNADQPDHRSALGAFHARLGELDSAIREYRASLRQAPRFAQSYIDLAEVLRVDGRAAEAERTLRDGVDQLPADPGMHYALGMLLANSGRPAEALPSLKRAAALRPDVPEFARAVRQTAREIGARQK